MTFGDFLVLIFADDQFRIITALVLANLVLGVVGSLVSGTFTIVRVSDYARTRLLPAIAVWSVAVLVSWAAPTDPILGNLRNVVFGTESLVLVGLLTANLSAFGITLPTSISGIVSIAGVPFAAAKPAAVNATPIQPNVRTTGGAGYPPAVAGGADQPGLRIANPGLGAILALIVLVLVVVLVFIGKLDAPLGALIGMLALARLT